MVRQAISLTDPCDIDDAGNLLTSAAAYAGSVSSGGTEPTPHSSTPGRWPNPQPPFDDERLEGVRLTSLFANCSRQHHPEHS
jgi:hypothetical protein